MTEIPEEDRDRVLEEYSDEDNLTAEEIEEDLRGAGFDSNEAEVFAQQIGGDIGVAQSREALQAAQRQAIESLGSGGAIEGEIVRGKRLDGSGGTAIGKPGNVTQEIERVSRTEGRVIARNESTGTAGEIGTVELPPPPGQ